VPVQLQLTNTTERNEQMDSRDKDWDTGTDDILGRYDELELVELGAADAYGGTGWACAAASAASAAFCPTTKCTSKC
jgi:hypothetical protein